MRYYIGFLIAIGLAIVLILLLFAGGGKPKSVVSIRHPHTLNSYASTDAEVSLTVDGPINADSLHQSYKVSVSNSEVNYEQFQGYNGTLVSSTSYANNENAYYAFLSALTVAGFTSGNRNPALSDNTGRCPLGTRTNYRLMQDGQTLENFWSSSCGGGTFLGNRGLTTQLFRAQFPQFGKLTKTINF